VLDGGHLRGRLGVVPPAFNHCTHVQIPDAGRFSPWGGDLDRVAFTDCGSAPPGENPLRGSRYAAGLVGIRTSAPALSRERIQGKRRSSSMCSAAMAAAPTASAS